MRGRHSIFIGRLKALATACTTPRPCDILQRLRVSLRVDKSRLSVRQAQPMENQISAALPAHSTDLTSLTLLEQVKARSDAAWQRLVEFYSPLVFSWCRRSGLATEDASDLVQEVFVSVAEHIVQFRRERPGDTFRGWLRTVARNRIALHFRRQSKEPHAVGGSAAQLRIQQLPAAPLEREPASPAEEVDELSVVLHSGLTRIRDEFEERTWRAFWLSAVEGLPCAEVAQTLQISAGAVRQAKYRVLRRVRSEMEQAIE